MTTTTQVSNEDRECVKSVMDWSISSQSTLEKAAGPTTNAHVPGRDMKRHECATSRVCKHCKQEKPLTEFYLSPNVKSGYESKCKECRKARCKDVYYSDHEASKARYTAHKQRYRSDPATVEREKQLRNKWREENKIHVLIYEAIYSAEKRKAIRLATPPWADMEKIQAIYIHARVLGMTVDHIIPLRGKNVSGLHVENNLQILPFHENRRKSNKLLDDIV